MARYFMIAGEASGDQHASGLVRELKKIDREAVFKGLGGDKMKNEGVELIMHYQKIAFMGFAEVFLHLGVILRALNLCKKELLKFQPDVIIFVDYPGFNLKMAEFAKKHHFKTVYYISPQVWAWKEKRVSLIKKTIDLMICILPFEEEFYAKHQYKVYFAGHPLVSVIADFQADNKFTERYRNKKVIAVLPGSRRQEVRRIFPIMASVFELFPDYQFLIAATPGLDPSFYQLPDGLRNAEVIYDQTYNILFHARAAMVASGTATLETALFGVPMVVCYKTSWLTYFLSRMLIKVRFISLVNLIRGKLIVKELIQNQLNRENLHTELTRISEDEPTRQYMKEEFKLIRHQLAQHDSVLSPAQLINGLLKTK